MQYELWARNRETGEYEFQDSFMDAKERYYRIDTVDTDLYKEAMILITDYDMIPRIDLYADLDKKPKSNISYKEEHINETNKNNEVPKRRL